MNRELENRELEKAIKYIQNVLYYEELEYGSIRSLCDVVKILESIKCLHREDMNE